MHNKSNKKKSNSILKNMGKNLDDFVRENENDENVDINILKIDSKNKKRFSLFGSFKKDKNDILVTNTQILENSHINELDSNLKTYNNENAIFHTESKNNENHNATKDVLNNKINENIESKDTLDSKNAIHQNIKSSELSQIDEELLGHKFKTIKEELKNEEAYSKKILLNTAFLMANAQKNKIDLAHDFQNKDSKFKESKNTESKNVKNKNNHKNSHDEDLINKKFQYALELSKNDRILNINTTQDNKKNQNLQNNKNDKNKKKRKTKNLSLWLGICFAILIIIILVPYKILSNGIALDSLEFQNVSVNNIYLKLEDKFILKIDNIKLNNYDDNNSANLKDIIGEVSHYIQKSIFIISYFKELQINKIFFNDTQSASITYTKNSYKVEMPHFNVDFDILNDHDALYLKVKKFNLTDFDVSFSGNIIYYTKKYNFAFNLRAFINAKNSSNEFIDLNGNSDFGKMALKASAPNIKNITFAKKYLDLMDDKGAAQTLKTWLFEKISFESLSINNIDSKINFKDIGNSILKNTTINLRLNNAKIMLGANVLPINAKYIDVDFKEKVIITPRMSEFSGFDLNNSFVENNNIPHTNVIINIIANNASINNNLRDLLRLYDIDLPLLEINDKNNLQSDDIYNDMIKNHQMAKNTESKSIDSQIKNSKIDKIEPSNKNVQNETKSKTSANIIISILHNDKNPSHPIVTVKGTINAQNTHLNLLGMDVRAKKIDVSLDINPNVKMIYINANNANFYNATDINIGATLDLNTHTLKGGAFVNSFILDSKNIGRIKLDEAPLKYAHNKSQIKTAQNDGIYLSNKNVMEILSAKLAREMQQYKIQKVDFINEEKLDSKPFSQFDNAPIDKKYELHDAKEYFRENKLQNDLKSKEINSEIQEVDLNDNENAPKKIQNQMPENSESILTKSQNINKNNMDGDGKIKDKAQKIEESKIESKNVDSKDLKITNSQTAQTGTQQHENKNEIKNISAENSNVNVSAKDDKNISHAKNQKTEDIVIMSKNSDVIKNLKHNKIWNELKIKDQKHAKIKELSQKEIYNIALSEVKNEAHLNLKQDFINIKNTQIDFDISFKDSLIINVPSININLINDVNGLKITANDMAKIVAISPILNYYGIHSGAVEFNMPYSNDLKALDTNNFSFFANLTNLDYPIYDFSNDKLNTIKLNAIYKNDTLTIKTDKNIDFKMKNSLNILRAKDYIINVDEALKSNILFIKEIFESKKDIPPFSDLELRQDRKILEEKQKIRKQLGINANDFNVQTKNMDVIFLGYTIPFDVMNLRMKDYETLLDASYGNGIVNANIIKHNMMIKAKNFSGVFVNKVIKSSGQKGIVNGGTFGMNGIYRAGILNADVEFQNTAFTDLKAIQNVFGVIDLVPSLVMFKNPNIGAAGYRVKYGKVYLSLNEYYIGLQDMVLVGDSMDVNGEGIVDIESKEMNMALNISTLKNLANILRKVPVFGYLLLGKDGRMTTNLILNGKYNDPEVHVTLVTDIIKMPFNILRRVFTPIDYLIETREK